MRLRDLRILGSHQLECLAASGRNMHVRNEYAFLSMCGLYERVYKYMMRVRLKLRQPALRMVCWAALFFTLASTVSAPMVYGEPRIQSKPPPLTSYEVTQIGQIIARPQAYTLHLVRCKGQVAALRTISHGRGMIPGETHVFTLTDSTGTIEIYYDGTYGYLGPLKTEWLMEGNLVDVLVHISSLNSSGSEGGGLAVNLKWVERQNN